MMDNRLHDLKALFALPLDALKLSARATRTLKWYHFSSVGDCLLFYVRDARGQLRLPLKLNTLLYGEVFERLVTEGHWGALESADMWQQIALKQDFGGPSITWWQGWAQNLYKVSIDRLKLSKRVCKRLKRYEMSSIGDCIDYYWHLRLSTPFHYPETLYEELETRLMALDCWDFIAEQFDG